MLTKMTTLKRKLETLREEEERLHSSTTARLAHLQDLHSISSLSDVKYETWSRVRVSRLLVDYLLREGYTASAAHLAASKGIEELVDVEAWVACQKVERSLREGSVALALEWCREHGKELKKGGWGLEFELRLQEYVELVREGHEERWGGEMEGLVGGGVGVSSDGNGKSKGEEKLVEARAHAKKYLSGSGDFEVVGRAAGLLAYRPWDNVEPYAVRCPHLPSQSCLLTIYTVPLRPLSLDPPRLTLPLHPPQPLFPPSPAPPPHRPQRRPLRAQNTRLPLRIHIFLRQRIIQHNRRVSHLQHRAQRASAQRSVRPAYQEYSGE